MVTWYDKQRQCLNCDFEFSGHDNFCPECGQKNTHPKISFGTLVVDFLGDVFTFDSKIFKSLWFLISKPGFLSKEFIEGKRIRYIPPLRMFIILGIIFVAVLNRTVDIGDENLFDITQSEEQEDVPDETSEALDDSPESANNESIVRDFGGVSYSFEAPTKTDSIPNSSINARLPWGIGQDVFNDSYTLARTTEKTTEEIALEAKASKLWEKALSRQVVKLARKGPQELLRWALNNLSLLFLIMVPLCAFIQKVLYARHDFFIIDHLIFSLHHHSLIYLAGTFIVIINQSWFTLGLILLALPLYTFLAISRVYGQKRVKTILKQVLLAVGYSLTFGFVSIAFVILSFIFF